MAKLIKECWARRTKECDGKVSREHVVSKAVLDLIGHFDLEVKHGGDVAYKKRIGVNSATIKFICRKHNADLSPYDKEALKLLKAIRGFAENKGLVQDEYKAKDGVRTVKIDGTKIELWAAKTLLNLSAYLTAVDTSSPTWGHGSSSGVFDCTFLGKPLERPYGLYAIHGNTLQRSADFKSRELCFKVIPYVYNFYSNEKGHWTGPFRVPTLFHFSAFGIEFVFFINMHSFTMSNSPDFLKGFLDQVAKGKTHVYRPEAIGFQGINEIRGEGNGNRSPPRVIEFGWT